MKEDPPDAVQARARLLAAQQVLLDAATTLSELLDRTRREIEAGRHHVEAGGAASDLPSVAGTPTVSADLTDALAAFAEARNATRVEMFTLAWDEGLSFEDIARTWGVSRQRISQIMNAAGRRSIKRPKPT